MSREDRLGWIVFGGSVALVLVFGAGALMFPVSGTIYCTEDFGSCFTLDRFGWRLQEKPCAAGESLRFITSSLRRCGLIRPSPSSGLQRVCPAACGR